MKSVSQRAIYTPMLIVALFTIANTWKQLKCPSMDEWIKKMWYIYSMKYSSAMRKKEIPPFVTIWMDFEGITLSEMSQTEKVCGTTNIRNI